MSYILDALKKSEEERNRGDIPGIQTYTPTHHESSNKKAWAIGVTVLTIINIVGLIIWAPWNALSGDTLPVPVVAQPTAMQMPVTSVPVARPAHTQTAASSRKPAPRAVSQLSPGNVMPRQQSMPVASQARSARQSHGQEKKKSKILHAVIRLQFHVHPGQSIFCLFHPLHLFKAA